MKLTITTGIEDLPKLWVFMSLSAIVGAFGYTLSRIVGINKDISVIIGMFCLGIIFLIGFLKLEPSENSKVKKEI